MYHKISAQHSDFFPALNTMVFQKQIGFIRKFFETVSLEKLTRHLKNRKTKISITFDDGYGCIYKHAYPILRKYRLPATIFLSVASIEKNIPIWSDLIAYYIGTSKSNSLELSIQGKKQSFQLRDDEGKLSASVQLKSLLKQVNNNERLNLLKEIKSYLDVADPDIEELRMLSWEEIKEMSENNIDFGAHTITHPILTRMSLEEARSEILESKRIIEEKTGKPVTTFAYPNGDISNFNDAIKRILKDGGFQYACTTIFGRNYQKTDPYELKRIYTSGNSILKFALRLWKAN